MRQSNVSISLRDENALACSYAVIEKEHGSVTIILLGKECAIFDSDELRKQADCRYLLLKHYETEQQGYRDFLRLIGKMCIKKDDSKYFAHHLDEDNRMIVYPDGRETMDLPADHANYDLRLSEFLTFIRRQHDSF